MRYIIPKGYVALDGTSLTVCEVHDPTQSGTIKKDIKGEQGPWFTVMLIAYTQAHVVLPQRQPGDLVNLEVDMLGKYVERVLTGALTEANDEASSSSSSSTSGVKQYVDQLVTRLVNQRLAERSK
jgi:riboflavin synthase